MTLNYCVYDNSSLHVRNDIKLLSINSDIYVRNGVKLLRSSLSHFSPNWLQTTKTRLRQNYLHWYKIQPAPSRWVVSSIKGPTCSKSIASLVNSTSDLCKGGKLPLSTIGIELITETRPNTDYIWHGINWETIAIVQIVKKRDKAMCITRKSVVKETSPH